MIQPDADLIARAEKRQKRLAAFKAAYFSTPPARIDKLSADAMIVVIDQEAALTEAQTALDQYRAKAVQQAIEISHIIGVTPAQDGMGTLANAVRKALTEAQTALIVETCRATDIGMGLAAEIRDMQRQVRALQSELTEAQTARDRLKKSATDVLNNKTCSCYGFGKPCSRCRLAYDTLAADLARLKGAQG